MDYLPNTRIEDYFNALQDEHPRLFSTLDGSIIKETGLLYFIKEMESLGGDFDGNAPHQRGDMYRFAQKNMLVRAQGIRQIFQLVCPQLIFSLPESDYKILDILGGDGTLAKAFKSMFPNDDVMIVTSDISGKMIKEANLSGLPAIRQPSHRLLLKPNTFDGLILAYGTHHIPKSFLMKTYLEALRVLKPGGIILAHDFEEGGAVATWFQEIVHPWSKTGHDFPHFQAGELQSGLLKAGFKSVKEVTMYDPLLLQADSPEAAREKLADYLINMYGLKKLLNKYGTTEARKVVLELAGGVFKFDYAAIGLPDSFGKQEITLWESNGVFKIELPRLALVAHGKKPETYK